MPTPFFVTLTPAGYSQFPNLYVAHVLEGYTPGSPPPRPTPGPTPPGGGGPVDPGYSPPWAQVPDRPPLDFWGPNDPRPTHPIVLPPSTPIPPGWVVTLPKPGEPGSPSNPYPPGEVPPHPATGLNTFYVIVPYVGVVGPFTMPPGVASTPDVPPPVPA